MTLEPLPHTDPHIRMQMVDARPKARFLGGAPEPRPIESGHIEVRQSRQQSVMQSRKQSLRQSRQY